ncbi:MAG: hypothetical protein AB3N20_17410 [Rhizobiaceae bacterium]
MAQHISKYRREQQFRGREHSISIERTSGKWVQLALVAAVGVLSACTTLTPDPEPEIQPIQIDMATLPGDYGLASYHQEEDQERTLEQAKIACSNPYTIGTGENGGVMMHAVGAKQPSEIFYKTDDKGRVFLGPRGAAGIEQDRYVVSYDERVLVMRWMEPRARTVYGTMIYVPCGQP